MDSDSSSSELVFCKLEEEGFEKDHEEENAYQNDYQSEEEIIVDKNELHFSFRSVFIGLLVGLLMCFSNMYFGLQTGWVTMGSLQSSILGFGIFRVLEKRFSFFRNFSPFENVILQTTSVAAATMPLAGGFVGIIPALKMLSPEETKGISLGFESLFFWCLGVAFFGVFFAVPLRKQTILKEKLRFPSGTATAHMIKVLHKAQEIPSTLSEKDKLALLHSSEREKEWMKKWKIFFYTFIVSAFYTFLSYFIPVLQNIPVFSWFGLHSFTEWNWTLTPSLSYVGQGMIMGTRTGISMLFGSIVGWAILGPIAKSKSWAPGPVNDWETGGKGWILWISLSIMLSEALVSLAILIVKMIWNRYKHNNLEAVEDPAPPQHLVPKKWWLSGLIISSVVAISVCTPVFHMPIYEPLLAILFALLVSVLAVRALGETDLNPVSGVGKISQIFFALISPHNIVSNLIAGAIAEAGAQQAGDLMQDLKTGHLLRASPRAQFFGQIIGSFFSIFFTLAAFELYTNAYQIPGKEFPVPTARIWLDMAKLLQSGIEAKNVIWFCIFFGIAAGLLPILSTLFVPARYQTYLPSGIAFAVAMYVTPNWTLPRVFGALLQYFWSKKYPNSYKKYMIVAASGFVLGEGIMSIVNALMKTTGVKPLF